MKSSLETLRPVSPAAPRESTANSPKTAIRKLERSNPSERALEKQAVCGSISALFARRFTVLARPLPAVFRITGIVYGPHPLAGGRSDALLHPCLLSSLEPAWEPLAEKQGYLQTLETDAKDPLSVAPK